MKKKGYIAGLVVVVLIAAIFVYILWPRDPLGPLARELRANGGYELYRPPRPDRGPGFVFSVSVNAANGELFMNVVCPRLFPEVELKPVPLTFPNRTINTTLGTDLGLKFINDLASAVLRDVATFVALQDSSSYCQRSASRLPHRAARYTISGSARKPT